MAATMIGAGERRELQRMMKAVTAATSGRERGPDRGVWRDSYDVDDARAAFRPFAANRREKGIRIRATRRALRERRAWVKRNRPRGLRLCFSDELVLEFLMGVVDAVTGRCEPAIDTIARHAGVARRTVYYALDRLEADGWIQRVRRTVVAGTDDSGRARREQTTNAYRFELGELQARVRQRVVDLIAEIRAAVTGAPVVRPSPPQPPPLAPDLARVLASLGRHLLPDRGA